MGRGDRSGRHYVRWILAGADRFFSHILILVAGVELGLIGFFGFSFLTWLFGHWYFVAYDVIGVSAVWQIFRQRSFG